MESILFEPLHPGVEPPARATEGSAGADLKAYLADRTFKKGLHVANSPGTVDCDYPDEWMVPVRNGGAGPLVIEHGERIAQVVLSRYEVIPFEAGSVAATTSRAGGFGSTGHR